MDADELRRRTKKAVGVWCGLDPPDFVMADLLEDLRGNFREELRQANNQEFRKNPGFPIDSKTWKGAGLKTVSDVRNLNAIRLAMGGK